jgi:pilus assembly protein CpaC
MQPIHVRRLRYRGGNFRLAGLGLALWACVAAAQTPPPPKPTTPEAPPAVPAPPPAKQPTDALKNPLLSPTPEVPAPVPSAATVEKMNKYIQKFIDPESYLDLVAGQTRVLRLKNTPFRVQAGEERIVSIGLATPQEILLQGKEIGSTVLTLWFGDVNDASKQETLTYLVRVYPDPEAKQRLERMYKQLEAEVNRYFKDTSIRLQLVGEKVVVSGRVRDAQQAQQVLQILRANMGQSGHEQRPLTPAGGVADPTGGVAAPGDDKYWASGTGNLINLLEVAGEQQVALRVIVAEVNRAAARSIGLNYSFTNNQGVTVFANLTGPIFNGFNNNAFAGAGGFGNFNQGGAVANLSATLDAGKIPLAINALRTLQMAKSLAEPVLVTMNGQTANFLAGGQFPVPVVANGNFGGGLQGVQYVPYGVQLSFTPFITDRDRIRLNLSANISARDVNTGTNIGGAGVAGLTARNVNTTVELRQGETLAVAGLIETNHGADATRVPLIGDLPIIGALASLNRVQSGEKELVIFITPELTRPLEPGQLPPLPGAEMIDPNDCEFYLLNRLEGRCRDFRSPVRTDWGRIKQYYQLEQAMIAGPTGYTPK